MQEVKRVAVWGMLGAVTALLAFVSLVSTIPGVF